MTPHRILQANALATVACAVGMLAAREWLFSLFRLQTPFAMDIIAAGCLIYAGALVFVSRRQPVRRRSLLAFTMADGLWVLASILVLVLFWALLSPLARGLLIAVAVVVEVLATLQYRAARATPDISSGMA